MKTSAVVVTRCDNYGGHQVERFIHSISSLCDAFDEVVIVDWNQPGPGMTLLEHAIGCAPGLIPRENRIKLVKVKPSDITELWPGLEDYPIIEVLARNIGLRRASGDWVLLTNPDCVISRQIPVNKLDDETMYTCSRSDVEISHFTRFTDTDELIIDLMKREYASKPFVDPEHPRNGDIWSLVVCCGDFQLAHKSVWDKIRGFEEAFTCYGCGIDTNVMKKAYTECKTARIGDTKLIFHLNHTKTTDFPSKRNLQMGNQKSMIQDFTHTTNSKNWGCKEYAFDTIIY